MFGNCLNQELSYASITSTMTAAILPILLVQIGLAYSQETTCGSQFVVRVVQTEEGVVNRCCWPIASSACPPGTSVQPCKEEFHRDWCKPCDPGLVQNSYSGTFNERPCDRNQSDVICTPEEDQVLVNGVPQCLCRTAEGYCGEPKNCLKVATTCPEGFQLHHRDCNCIQVATGTTTAAPAIRTTTLPMSSTPTSPPSSSLAATQTTSMQNPMSPKQDMTKSEKTRLADNPPPFDADEDKEAVNSKGSPNGSDQTGTIIEITTVVIFLLVLAVVVVCVLRRRGNTTSGPMMFCNWFSYNTIKALDEERGDNGAPPGEQSDPPSMVLDGSLVDAVEEERRAIAEEGSMGEASDQTLPKQSGSSFYQPLNPRTSPEMVECNPSC